jgi:hypothetical protein
MGWIWQGLWWFGIWVDEQNHSRRISFLRLWCPLTNQTHLCTHFNSIPPPSCSLPVFPYHLSPVWLPSWASGRSPQSRCLGSLRNRWLRRHVRQVCTVQRCPLRPGVKVGKRKSIQASEKKRSFVLVLLSHFSLGIIPLTPLGIQIS